MRKTLTLALFLLVAGLFLLSRLGSLQLPTVLAYSGIGTLIGGILSALLPPRWSGFSRRRHGLFIGLAAGCVLLAAGLLWPVAEIHTASKITQLDAFLPDYHFAERHEILIDAPAPRVRAALDQLSMDDLPAVRTLGTIRSVAMGNGLHEGPLDDEPRTTMVQSVTDPRSHFFLLADTPREFVFGMAGQPWNNRGLRLRADEFRAWMRPDHIKVAANFLIEDAGPGRTRLVTETRVAATSDSARRKMARYWALIYPGSGLLRVHMLEAVRDRALQNTR